MNMQISLPEDLYARLAAIAAQRGQSAEALLREAATQIVEEANTAPLVPSEDEDVSVEGYDPATDPLAPFAGIYASDEPGWIERHNEYYVGVRREHGDKK
jgi:plasmid stability protein